MNITGRITKDAVVKTVPSGKQVVEFSIAENHYYKGKGEEKATNHPTYFNCSYWINTGVAVMLRKGAVVELTGRAGTNPYINKDGVAAASLIMTVEKIKVHPMKNNADATEAKPVKTAAEITEPVDDLPF